MATREEWQCRKCGNNPSGFTGDLPSAGGDCPAGGGHVWLRVPAGSTRTLDWQCFHCGKNPTGFTGPRPTPSEGCPVTGFKHVWIQI